MVFGIIFGFESRRRIDDGSGGVERETQRVWIKGKKMGEVEG